MGDVALKICILFFAGLVALDFMRVSRSAKIVIYIPVFLFMAFFGAAAIFAFDVPTYEGLYNRQEYPTSWEIDSHPEFGYQLLTYSFKWIGLNFFQFKFIHIFIILILFYLVVAKFTRWISVFFFLAYPKLYLVGIISHMRSALIFPFGYVILFLVDKKKYLWVILLSLLLSQIHLSAIFFIALLFLNRAPLNRTVILLVIPLALISGLYLSGYINMIGELFDIRQAHYFNTEEEEAKSLIGIEVMRRIVIVVLIFFLFHFSVFKTNLHHLAIKSILFGIFIYIAFIDAKFISERVGNLFGIYEPLVFVFWISESSRRHKKNLAHDPKLAWGCTAIYLLLDIYSRFFINSYFPAYDISVWGL